MDCRHVLDEMPPVPGDDRTVPPEIARHLESCPACRERVKARAGAAAALTDGLEDLRADPMTPDEMAALLADAERVAPRGRRFAGAVAAAILLAAAGAGVLLLRSRPEPVRFATGPQVAGAEDVTVRPPPLRVPRSPSWDAEPYRALLSVTAEGTTMRLSYEPADGSDTVRRFAPGEWSGPPRPKGAPESALVAVLLAADASCPWTACSRVLRNRVPVVLYLAGREEEGSLGAVEALVPKSPGERSAMRQIERLGAAVTPRDMSGGFPLGRVLQFRITRSEGGTRFRYGIADLDAVPGSVRFGLGDVLRSDAELSGPDGDSALPGLRDWIAGAEPGRERALAFLEAGTGVRYLDVLRAVESGQGCWFLPSSRASFSDPRLAWPEPLDAADAAVLSEEPGTGPRTVVTILRDGIPRVRGAQRHIDEIEFGEPESEVLLYAASSAPFASLRAVLERARAADTTVRMVFAPEDPEIGWERTVEIPWDGLSSTVTVELRAGPDGRVIWTQLPGRFGPETEVRVVVLGSFTAGDVLPVVLRLIRLGAASIRFD